MSEILAFRTQHGLFSQDTVLCMKGGVSQGVAFHSVYYASFVIPNFRG